MGWEKRFAASRSAVELKQTLVVLRGCAAPFVTRESVSTNCCSAAEFQRSLLYRQIADHSSVGAPA